MSEEIIEEQPVKKRGRPKGSKNKDTNFNDRLGNIERSIELLTSVVSKLAEEQLTKKRQQEETKTIQEKLESNEESKVTINVQPEVTINGVKYHGKVTIPKSLADRLQVIIKDRRDMQAKEPIYVNHGDKLLRIISNA